jgi:hypothetical protein
MYSFSSSENESAIVISFKKFECLKLKSLKLVNKFELNKIA